MLTDPPGSGKTSTAETIAAYIGKQLYAITCGDVGTEPKELERNLTKHTRLAENGIVSYFWMKQTCS
jgi:MoxR-like ATPase